MTRIAIDENLLRRCGWKYLAYPVKPVHPGNILSEVGPSSFCTLPREAGRPPGRHSQYYPLQAVYERPPICECMRSLAFKPLLAVCIVELQHVLTTLRFLVAECLHSVLCPLFGGIAVGAVTVSILRNRRKLL